MNKKNRWITLLLAFVLFFSGLGDVSSIWAAEQNVVNISTKEDLMSLAQKCRLDTWSQNKVVKLTKDIDISGADFKGIPTFGGTFEGNGHSIVGVNISNTGKNQGFFRQIQEGAIIKNLTIKGNILVNGTRKNIGGIAGRNAGTIKDTIFVGTVKGESYIGGITGVNEAKGQVINCITQGVVLGEHYVGGITGQNLGIVLNSKNKMSVNTSNQDNNFSLDNLEKIQTGETSINDTENLSSKTDIGGIAGFSTGIIQGCQNFGKVGYQHVGYNIGGIVGRQSGYVYDCTNHEEVLGRKDVGGIVGQMEPYLSLEFSEGKAAELQQEFNKLQKLMNQTISDAGGYSSELGTQLNKTKEHIDLAIKTTQDLAGQTADFYNQSIGQINDFSARISSTLEQLVPIQEQLYGITSDIPALIDQIEVVLKSLEVTGDEGKKVLKSLENALEVLRTNMKDYTKAMEEIGAAIQTLKNSVGDEKAMKEAVSQLGKGFTDLSNGLNKMAQSLQKIGSELKSLSQWIKNNESIADLGAALQEAGQAVQEMKAASDQVATALKAIKGAADENQLKKALQSLEQAGKAMMQGAQHLKNAFDAYKAQGPSISGYKKVLEEVSKAQQALKTAEEQVKAAVSQLKESLSGPEAEEATEHLKQALKDLEQAIQNALNASEKISAALEELKDSELKDVLEESLFNMVQSLQQINEGLQQIKQGKAEVQEALSQIGSQIDTAQISLALTQLEKGLEALHQAGSGTQDVVAALKDVVSQTQGVMDQLQLTNQQLQKTAQLMKNISEKISGLTQSAYALIKDLAGQPAIAFPSIDSDYMANANQLSTTLGDISNALGNVNQVMKEHNELILSDLKGISDQFFNITNLVIDMMLNVDEESTDISDYKQDISDADTNGNTQGKVAKSINGGHVQGDVNVGGISGSMAIEYDFDLEDDVKKIGTPSLKFQYLARAVIRECTNRGLVTAKKNYVGGIVGRMDLGMVKGSMASGKIESTAGDYVGGISGASYSQIKDSFSMAVVSGGKNIGGIAGYGDKLINNYAMVEIQQATESKGAIAGSVETSSTQKNNYFVDLGIAGIDDISYGGKAEPISYNTFIENANLPAEFKKLQLTFVADGKEVAVLPFTFNGSIETEKLPQVPQKEGYYGRWPENDYKGLTFSQTLEAIYTPYVSSIASSMTQDGKVLALAEGTFDEDTVLSVVQSEIQPPSQASQQAKVYEVMVTGDNYETNQAVKLRLLAGDKGKTTLYALQKDGSWKKVNTKKSGSYMMTQLEGNSQVFCIDTVNSHGSLILAIGGGILLVAAGIFIIKKKKRDKPQS